MTNSKIMDLSTTVNDELNGSKRRLTTSNKRRSIRMIDSDIIDATPVDDEFDRSRRRKSIIQNPRRSIISKAGTNTSLNNSKNTSLDISTRLKNVKFDDVTEHVTTCIKFFETKKSGFKNQAWNMQVIDMIGAIVANADKNQTDEEIVRLATNSLECGAKIFEIRVDDVYEIGTTMANKIADRSIDKDETTMGEESQPETKKRKKRSRTAKSNFVVELDELIAPVAQTGRKELAIMRETGEAGMSYLNYLEPDLFDRFDLVGFARKTSRFFEETVDALSAPHPTDELVELTLPEIKGERLVQAFMDFDLLKWRQAEEALDELILDENDRPIAQLDATINDIFAAPEPHDISEEEEEEGNPVANLHFKLNGLAVTVHDFIPASMLDPNCFSFVDVERTGMLFGPSHWKAKFVKRMRPVYTGAVEPEKRQKKRKVVTRIDFEANVELDMGDVFVMQRRPPRTTIDKITLPERRREPGWKSLWMLTSKPKSRIRTDCGSSAIIPAEELNASTTNCNNESVGDCGGGDWGSVMEECGQAQEGDFQSEVLVNRSEFDETMAFAPFAMKAKDIDMIKLKCEIYTSIERGVSDFRTIYLKLKDSMDGNKKEQLTPHITLNALLHLCNEKQLVLKTIDKCNFTITRFKTSYFV